MLETLGIVQLSNLASDSHRKAARRLGGKSVLEWVVRRVTDCQRQSWSGAGAEPGGRTGSSTAVRNYCPIANADASRLAALRLGRIPRYSSLGTPCQPRASAFS